MPNVKVGSFFSPSTYFLSNSVNWAKNAKVGFFRALPILRDLLMHYRDDADYQHGVVSGKMGESPSRKHLQLQDATVYVSQEEYNQLEKRLDAGHKCPCREHKNIALWVVMLPTSE